MVALLLSFLVAGGLSWWICSGRSWLAIMDHPNDRSLHERPIPRSGGIAILLAIGFGWCLLLLKHGMPAPMPWMMAAAASVAAISLFDDLFELPAHLRFPVHVLAALLALLGGIALEWNSTGWLVSFMAILWMINLYNFMDGMDGFAGGMTLTGFAFLGIGGFVAGDPLYAWWCWAVAAAALGFLLFNFPPARIFMGDVGSATLGLLAAALSLWGIHEALFALWFPLLVFSPFWVDATATLLRRAWRREKVWRAHHEHYYQRTVRSGWGHRKTVIAEYVVMLASGGTALALLVYPKWWIVGLLVWGGIYLILAYKVDVLFARRRR